MFREMYKSVSGANVYINPINPSPRGDYFHVEIKGEPASCLTPLDFQSIAYIIHGGVDIHFARLDLAFDYVPFSPSEFIEALKADDLISRAARESIEYNDSPFQPREDNEIGCQTAYIGSKSSERRIRVYNLHGPTRLEFQLRGDWAHVISILLLDKEYSEWLTKSISFVRQFVEIDRPWWKEFTENSIMGDIVVKSARAISLDRLEKWIAKQVVPGLFALQAVMGMDEFWGFVVSNLNDKRLEKWKPIIEMAYGGGENGNIQR